MEQCSKKKPGRNENTLDVFDHNPGLMAEIVSEVISSEEFQERDGAEPPLMAQLANILPGSDHKKKNTRIQCSSKWHQLD
jgi:hypothetical protein